MEYGSWSGVTAGHDLGDSVSRTNLKKGVVVTACGKDKHDGLRSEEGGNVVHMG